MTLQTEPVYTGEYILSEGNRTISRDVVTIDQNQTLVPGTVLGQSLAGALTATFAALGANTGNPTCSAITVAAGTTPGEYDLHMTDATHFVVLAPPVGDGAGEEVGHGVFGAAFAAGGLGFTITAGGTACVDGDSFKIPVAVAAADGDFVRFNPAATDGSQNARCICFAAVTTGAGQTAQAVVTAREAEVIGALLDWGTANGGQIAAATAQLLGLKIVVR